MPAMRYWKNRVVGDFEAVAEAGFDSGDGAPMILNAVTLVLFLAGCAAVLVMGLKAPRTPRIAELLTLIVGFFLLFNKVWSPQYSIWLVPLLVLALVGLRGHGRTVQRGRRRRRRRGVRCDG